MNILSPTVQLFLPVQMRLEKSFENYLGHENQAVIACLKEHIERKHETLVVLVGPESVGKTHLLASSIVYYETFYQSDIGCAYFSLSELSASDLYDEQENDSYFSDLLDYFESFNFLALDDIDLWLNCFTGSHLEEAELFVFNLFNHYKMNGKLLMITSKCPPGRLNVQLKDLQSRLQSGLLLTLSGISDVEKEGMLKSLAKLKGFLMDDEVSAFILKRSDRDIPALLEVIDNLDKATLIEKRKLTVPFVKKVLNW
tara:strand:- start:25389 stop:26156 length:768 start_codon:yes stop_codon:yes gene_type:complete